MSPSRVKARWNACHARQFHRPEHCAGLASLDVLKREALPTKHTQHPDADHASGSGQLALTWAVGHQEALPYPSGNPYSHAPALPGYATVFNWNITYGSFISGKCLHACMALSPCELSWRVYTGGFAGHLFKSTFIHRLTNYFNGIMQISLMSTTLKRSEKN